MNIETIPLGPTLTITLCDQTSHYFGGYYHVKVLAYCDIPLESGYFDSASEFSAALEKMGASVRFERVLEKMAVPDSGVEAVRSQLTRDFRETVTSYLATADFAPRFVRSEYLKCAKKTSHIRTPRA